ncbi:MAG: acyl--CoA ligase [Spirochaetales bacterium]|jgi:acyl-CoA synthetase (AMP-forming)/AMP-acid ligase II|nr:acyl--CoA ligase [Spirochaetales bacterium]MBQ3831437.1 acyl--CoA ligase [Spirochaetales bacterium]MBQ7282192.1 acyl--CoA ligase [Spirochaetales bacterium]MBQ7728868.1 acyl--CoA ligase [Spirochaetales bacterium]MBQ9809669.1 acyl--CoA ligase [Spirochaetales bacterium]
MVITDFLERNSRLYGQDTALVVVSPSEKRDQAVTWREASLIESATDSPYRREINWRTFDQMANRFANLLLSREVPRGTKVGILMMNCLEYLPIYFGVLKAGCIVVPMNYRYSSDEIKYCLDLADVEILVFGPEFTARMDAIADDIPKVRTMFYVGNNGPIYTENCMKVMGFTSTEAPPISLNEDDYAAIYFSSGTTGFPKAILHKHRALYSSCLTEQNHHGQTKDDVFLCIPPLYHTGAKMHWFGSLMTGGKAVILRGIKPEWILRTVTEEKCTIVWLLVPWVQDILDAIDSGRIKLDDYLLNQWRLMHVGAQPVPPSLIKRWLKVFPHHQYDTNYGLSESIGPGCVHLGVENVDKVGAIGIPGYLWEAKIVKDDGKTEVTEPEEVGELAVKGPGVMDCYYKNPEATEEILKGEWLLTGDMAKKDADGFIYLVDRKKDVIITGGENLYPVQIEDFLRKYDKIKDVAVIGLPHQRLGEIAAAIISVKDGMKCTEEEIVEFCNDLPRYKRPRKIIFADVPRNPTGKIEKPVLRERYRAANLVEQQITS